MTSLLDVNVLIALIDQSHSAHMRAHGWFDREGHCDFATCPITENGLVRIVGNPRYGSGSDSPTRVLEFLRALRQKEGHSFWPDDISLLHHDLVDPAKILNAAQITDTYLLALAAARGGKLATFDRRLVVTAVRGGSEAFQLIE